MTRSKFLQDWVNLILAVLLFISPWVLGFSTDTTASSNAWVCGIVMAIIAIAALSAFAEWEEWLEMLVGAWVVISPWILGYAMMDHIAAWTHVILGALVILFAATEVYQFKHITSAGGPPRPTPVS